MSDDDADSLLRAIAAAPAIAPAARVTVMVIRAGSAVPIADQWNVVRAQLASAGVSIVAHGDDMLAITWSDHGHAARAAACALELRDKLTVAIALASGAIPYGRADSAAALIDRAAALVDSSGVIRLDDDTAELVKETFSLDIAADRSRIALLGRRAVDVAADRLIGAHVAQYRIEAPLGGGGMGKVYRAVDVQLQRPVAIKFLLSDSAAARARFLREARAASALDHPNIGTVYQVGEHEGEPFLAMALYEGQTLRERIAAGPVPVDEAVAILAQLVTGLAAAHAAGLVHRDIKPSNVILPRGGPVKLLDFGLAKSVAGNVDEPLTRSGDMVGTAHYMAPEQIRDESVDARADLWAVGVVAFEMLVGRLPFQSDSAHAVLAKILTDDVRLAELPAGTPPWLRDLISRLLDKKPARRPANAEQVREILARRALPPSGLSQTIPGTPAGRARHQRRRRWAIATIAAAALAALLGTAVVVRTVRRRLPANPGRASSERTFAIVDPFDKAGRADDAWIGTAIGEVVAADLGDSGQVRVVPGADVARMKADLEIGATEAWSKQRLQQVRRAVGADYVIAGSYTAADGQLTLDLQIYDTTSGRVVGGAHASGAASGVQALGARAATDIERAVGTDVGTVAASPALVLPARSTAARYYAEAVARFRRDDFVAAKSSLTRAVAEDPDDPLIHDALAATWKELGYDANAATEAKLAFDHSSGLTKEKRLAIEARYRETTVQWDQAIDAYRTLFEFFPTRLDYGLELVAAETQAGDAKSAYATLDALRKLPLIGEDPRIELADAEAADAADDIERERAHAERAATLARARGARLVLGKARFHEGWALWTLGRDAEAKAAYAEAEQIFKDLNDRRWRARCLNNIALAAHRDRHDDEASRAFDSALRLATEIGDTTTQAWLLNNWAYMLTDQGDLARALELYRKKLELGGARGDTPPSQAAAHANIAEILRWRGDLAGARGHAQAAEDLLRGLDARRFAAFTEIQRGEIDRAEDDLTGSHKRLEHALGWASDAMAPAEAAQIRMSLARTEIDAGRPHDGEAVARVALSDLRAAKDTGQEVCAIAALASALLAAGRSADAARELAAAPPRDGASFACSLDFELASAMAIALDASRSGAAVAALRAVGERARKAGYSQYELDVRLALASLGADDARAVARAATAKGFRQVARRAAALAKKR